MLLWRKEYGDCILCPLKIESLRIKVLSKLTKGSEVEVTLPADKAFGDIGVENLIPPNVTLIFDIKISL
ncbi:FKBP-type peptidyl-prolyl cis-trans isomerase [Pantoea dispersa]|uniref:FKBP-type peptidyl-prolyl cis-trans isomerase n=1 Tax=Pantoea dispersa TaxID=59814 RepID=UPI003B8A7A0A